MKEIYMSDLVTKKNSSLHEEKVGRRRATEYNRVIIEISQERPNQGGQLSSKQTHPRAMERPIKMSTFPDQAVKRQTGLLKIRKNVTKRRASNRVWVMRQRRSSPTWCCRKIREFTHIDSFNCP